MTDCAYSVRPSHVTHTIMTTTINTMPRITPSNRYIAPSIGWEVSTDDARKIPGAIVGLRCNLVANAQRLRPKHIWRKNRKPSEAPRAADY
jgi:hypothetical protein